MDDPTRSSAADDGLVLADHAALWARVAAANVLRPYPYVLTRLLRGPEDLTQPRRLHPAFYGAYDWHSCVHMHWLLVRLLRRAAHRIDAEAASSALDANLTTGNLAAEAAWLRARPGFERPYGLAWLTMLAAECRAAAAEGVPRAPEWVDALRPVVEAACGSLETWLSKATYPVRHGAHANSAFSLGLLLDAAPLLGPAAATVATAATQAVHRWYRADRDYPARWEPSGEDFLSPALTEADTVRRVLPRAEFAGWLTDFLPGLATGEPAGLLTPPTVSDPSDPLIGHLLGLHLSRAAALRSLAAALPASDPRPAVLTASAAAHLRAARPHIVTGDFTTDHWLATFATLAVEAGKPSDR